MTTFIAGPIILYAIVELQNFLVSSVDSVLAGYQIQDITGYVMTAAAFAIGAALIHFGIKGIKDKEKVSGVLFVIFSLAYIATGITFILLANASFT